MNLFAIFLFLAYVVRNWYEAKTYANIEPDDPMPWLTGVSFWVGACLRDVFPFVLLAAIFRVLSGGLATSVGILLAFGLWLAVSYLFLQARGPNWWRGIPQRLLRDIGDGWLAFGAYASWMGWLTIVVPQQNIPF